MNKQELSMEEIQKKLSEPFTEDEIDWRVMRSMKAQNGKAFAYAIVTAYVQSRAIMNRLDSVVGIGNWENEFTEIHNGIICGIKIHLPDGKTITKWDGADLTNIESTKGGISGAMKRAAVQWGIGRYLYKLDEQFVEVFPETKKGKMFIKDTKNNFVGSWNPPNLPTWALPGEKNKDQTTPNSQSPSENNKEKERKEVNRFINNFEKAIGLNQNPEFINRIFNKANNTQVEGLGYVRNASVEELQRYCKALKPIYSLVQVGNNYKISMEELLTFVQTFIPGQKIESIYSCFFILTEDVLKKVERLARDTYHQRQQAS